MPTQQTQRDLDHKIIFSSRRNHFFFCHTQSSIYPWKCTLSLLTCLLTFWRLFLQNEQKSCSYFQYKFIFSPFLPKPLYGSMILSFFILMSDLPLNLNRSYLSWCSSLSPAWMYLHKNHFFSQPFIRPHKCRRNVRKSSTEDFKCFKK